ncbi:MAG TPA: hypothetical protein VFN13_10510 [Rudaea sp.]|nr:hypothetical protein [Rudaea sp.]
MKALSCQASAKLAWQNRMVAMSLTDAQMISYNISLFNRIGRAGLHPFILSYLHRNAEIIPSFRPPQSGDHSFFPSPARRGSFLLSLPRKAGIIPSFLPPQCGDHSFFPSPAKRGKVPQAEGGSF